MQFGNISITAGEGSEVYVNVFSPVEDVAETEQAVAELGAVASDNAEAVAELGCIVCDTQAATAELGGVVSDLVNY